MQNQITEGDKRPSIHSFCVRPPGATKALPVTILMISLERLMKSRPTILPDDGRRTSASRFLETQHWNPERT
ncbi:hypothetical protein ATANTOWER_030081 [Ataeniobius toweri]|uniref:Uncharacterized protein n=1 Tax=Ataeniobius toweri TaxID=208326 RepID=A0ABU7C1K6_9TELE|nr:hypothetical protein [Ataeniobius toweri]